MINSLRQDGVDPFDARNQSGVALVSAAKVINILRFLSSGRQATPHLPRVNSAIPMVTYHLP